MAHRHQPSLEGIIDFTPASVVFENATQRQHAENLFFAILTRLDGDQQLSTPFRRVEMVRLMHSFSRSQQSKDLFLESFFGSIQVDMTFDPIAVDFEPIPSKVVNFTDYLIYNFFLPLKASSTRTPQPTPASLSVPSLSAEQVLSGSAARIASLRRDCLIRDKHRCVISRRFCVQKARMRVERDGNNAVDDDGIRFLDLPRAEMENLQVAHILPHSLTNMDGQDDAITVARRNALAILDMFDVGVRHLIEGPNIDRPTNAITLTTNLHGAFGSFETFFEPVSGAEPHTYRIDSVLPAILRRPLEPITRTLYVSETIDLPLPRLFAIHAVVCRILHMTGAGCLCDKILRDTEEHMAKADGSTNLGTLTALRLGGWLDGVMA